MNVSPWGKIVAAAVMAYCLICGSSAFSATYDAAIQEGRAAPAS